MKLLSLEFIFYFIIIFAILYYILCYNTIGFKTPFETEIDINLNIVPLPIDIIKDSIENNQYNIETGEDHCIFDNTPKTPSKYYKENYVAIVAMMKQPTNLEKWLDYHINKLKFDHIYLRIEDTPELKRLESKCSQYNKNLTIIYESNVDTKNNYWTIQTRQINIINETINKVNIKKKELGIQDAFLLHIDDDELLYINPKFEDVKHMFYSNKDIIKNNKINNVHFYNFEAVFPKNQTHCFNTDQFIDCSLGGCKSYANGKSAGVITENSKSNGPHYFKGKSINVPKEDALVLHFDSCVFEKWYKKFSNLSNTKNEKDIPFGFYKDSINLVKTCANEQQAKDFYNKNKKDPYYKKINNKVKIDIDID